LADLACHVCVIDDGGYAYCRPVLVVHHSNELAKPRCVTRHVPSRRRRGRNIRSGAASAARRGCSARPFWTALTNWAAGGLESGYVVGLAADGRVRARRAPRLYRPRRLEFTFSVSETGLSVSGGDVGVEALVDPVALAEKVE